MESITSKHHLNNQNTARKGIDTMTRDIQELFYSPKMIRSIRLNLNQSQSEFAYMINIQKATLQSWEQGRRKPDRAAMTLLKIVANNPSAVMEALHI